MSRTRAVSALALALALASCGGDSAGPNPPGPVYPALGGNYQILGAFNGIPDNIGWLDGTFSIQQPSRSTETFGGQTRIVVHLDGDLFEFEYPLSEATVTTTGAVRFVIRESPSDAWTFTAQLTGTTMNGSHTIVAGGSTGSLSGTFTASRSAGSGRAAALAVRAVDGPAPTLADVLDRARAR